MAYTVTFRDANSRAESACVVSVIVWLQFLGLVCMVVRAVFSRVFVFVLVSIACMSMLVRMLMLMFMAVDVGVFVSVHNPVMGVLMGMNMSVVVLMLVAMIVLTFHWILLRLPRMVPNQRGRTILARSEGAGQRASGFSRARFLLSAFASGHPVPRADTAVTVVEPNAPNRACFVRHRGCSPTHGLFCR